VDLQSVINSRFGIGLGLSIGRLIPPQIGYQLAKSVGLKIANRKDSAMVQAARANQWVISGEKLSSEQLDQAVINNLKIATRCQYDLYHNIKNTSRIMQMVKFTDSAEEAIQMSLTSNKGFIAVGLHISSLDIGFIALSQRGVRVLAISVPEPGGGYRWQNDLRKELGFEFYPASKSAFRAAQNRLNNGGSVISGIDRPIEDTKYRPNFFGRPASLPVFHVLLGLKFKLPIYITYTVLDDDGLYRMQVSEPIFMKPFDSRYDEIINNAEAVLKVAEEIINQVPQQWVMYYPVWPDVMDLVPG